MARDFAIKNPERLLENMVLVRDILASRDIACFLHFGTLLGAIREKGFIPHDDDADLGVFTSDFDAVINLIPEFVAHGFSFCCKRTGRLFQLTRKDEQVDIFFVSRRYGITGRKWEIDERTTVSPRFLDKLGTIQFYGHDFSIPSNPEGLMRNLYGKTWKIPLKNIPSRTNWTWRLRKLAKNPQKIFYYVFRFMGTQRRKSK